MRRFALVLTALVLLPVALVSMLALLRLDERLREDAEPPVRWRAAGL